MKYNKLTPCFPERSPKKNIFALILSQIMLIYAKLRQKMARQIEKFFSENISIDMGFEIVFFCIWMLLIINNLKEFKMIGSEAKNYIDTQIANGIKFYLDDIISAIEEHKAARSRYEAAVDYMHAKIEELKIQYQQDEIINEDEAMELLGIKFDMLTEMIFTGVLPGYQLIRDGKFYLKKSEVLASMKQVKYLDNSPINKEAKFNLRRRNIECSPLKRGKK